MAMGRKPKPTHLKLVKGTGRKSRMNHAEAVLSRDLPMPPPHLHDYAKVEWGRVSTDLYQAGLLSKVDRAALAAYCQAYARWQVAEETLAKVAGNDPVFHGLLAQTTNKNMIQSPLVGVANKAMADMMRYATDLGMTPSARSRVTAKPPAPGQVDPAAEFFR
jgi:P27 family predicted phage terminase small subunit